MNLFGKRLKMFKIDRTIKTIGMTIKTLKHLITA